MNCNISDQLAQLVTLAQLQQQNMTAMGADLSDLKEVLASKQSTLIASSKVCLK